MEKTNKVMRIVLSIVTFVVVALFVVSLFALPVESSVIGNQTTNLNIYDINKSFFQSIEQMQAMGEQGLQLLPAILAILMTMVFAIVFGIIALVKGIILLVKTIKGMSGKGELEPLLKSLVGFGSILVIYIALLLGIIYSHNPAQSVSLGAGTDMMLSCGIVSLAIAGAYRIAVKDERKLVNKILSLATSALVITGILVAFSASVAQGEDTSFGLLVLFPQFISFVASGHADSSVITGYVFAVIGVVAICVSLGMAKGVICNGFTVDVEGKKPDFAKSSIVKSAVWFGLMVVGFVLIVVGLNKGGIGLGAGAIVGMVMGALALAAAIVNKVLANKSKAPEAEEPKAE